MKSILAIIPAILAASAFAGSSWPASAKQKAKDLLAEMTVDEKIQLVHGWPYQYDEESDALKGYDGYVGGVPPISRLNIPRLSYEDGPQGVADGVSDVTAWPSAMTVVSTFDPEMMKTYGQAMGKEQRGKGTNVMLGPMVNMARVPQDGRSFESCGEDPVLCYGMMYAEVEGIQSNNILACTKHWVANNGEFQRHQVTEIVSERAMHELYYWAFRGGIDAGSGVVMCSYNRVSVQKEQPFYMVTGEYACENNITLPHLKTPESSGGLGFEGYVQSDWGATHSTVQAAINGLDQQMPDDSFFGDKLKSAVQSGQVPESRLDDMIERILTPMLVYNLFTDVPTGNLSSNVMSKEHSQLARNLSANSHVLLKVDSSLLPLDVKAQGIKSIAVIGDQNSVHGGGSGGVRTPYIVTPADGIAARANGPRPLNCTFVNNTDFFQPGNPSVQSTGPADCCAQCTARPDCNAFTFQPPSTCWIKPDNSGRQAHQGLTSGTCAPYDEAVNVTYYDGKDPSAAAAAAAAADVAVVVVAVTSSEGSDRPNLSLPGGQDALVQMVLQSAAAKTVVVVRSPGAVLMPWADDAKNIIASFMPGQEAGNALADVLFGDVNGGARLPLSFPVKETDTWIQSTAQYPGNQAIQQVYTEELEMGYRWFDAKNIKPLFPFGHGLSYTTFSYSKLEVKGQVSASGTAQISFDVSNTGSRAGGDAPQVYLAFPSSAGEPPKVMRGFDKVYLGAGESTTVTVSIAARDCSIWDTGAGQWKLIGGSFGVLVGASSGDIRIKGTMDVQA